MTLKEQREAAGMTQAEASSFLGVTVTTISRWETNEGKPGKSRPNKHSLKALVRMYASKKKVMT